MPPDNRKPDRSVSPRTGPEKHGAVGQAPAGPLPRAGEVYFEFRSVGAFMRVNIIDGATGQETYVLGPLNASREHLQNLALRKLRNMKSRKG